MSEDFSFPVYRKYAGNLSYFRIESPTRFTEIKIWGTSCTLVLLEAKIYPDKLYIADMLLMREGRWLESHVEEFEEALRKYSKYSDTLKKGND